jgi:hypothetical protein
MSADRKSAIDNALLGTLHQGTALCALHSYAELYAVLSGKPGKPRLRPTDGLQGVDACHGTHQDQAAVGALLNRDRDVRAIWSQTAEPPWHRR